jgi:hypothetical protein
MRGGASSWEEDGGSGNEEGREEARKRPQYIPFSPRNLNPLFNGDRYVAFTLASRFLLLPQSEWTKGQPHTTPLSHNDK